jgi:hypothetical protein
MRRDIAFRANYLPIPFFRRRSDLMSGLLEKSLFANKFRRLSPVEGEGFRSIYAMTNWMSKLFLFLFTIGFFYGRWFPAHNDIMRCMASFYRSRLISAPSELVLLLACGTGYCAIDDADSAGAG